jgi:hypothetical protein
MCIPFSTWLVIILVHTGAIWDLSPFRLALYGLYLWKLGLQWTQKLVMCPARPFMGLDHFDPYWYPENIIRPYEGLLRLALQLLFCEGFFIKFSSLEQPLLELAPCRQTLSDLVSAHLQYFLFIIPCSPTVFPFYHPIVFPIWSLLNHIKPGIMVDIEVSWNGVPPNHPWFFICFSILNHPFLGTPMTLETSISGGYPLVNVYIAIENGPSRNSWFTYS